LEEQIKALEISEGGIACDTNVISLYSNTRTASTGGVQGQITELQKKRAAAQVYIP
jgi:hypothetical protein